MAGISPTTGLTVSGSMQLKERAKKAITTQQGSVEKRRNEGGEFRSIYGLANPENRLKAINRIHRILANPYNQLSKMVDPVVLVEIGNAGFNIQINYTYDGEPESLTL